MKNVIQNKRSFNCLYKYMYIMNFGKRCHIITKSTFMEPNKSEITRFIETHTVRVPAVRLVSYLIKERYIRVYTHACPVSNSETAHNYAREVPRLAETPI